ncbi:hypothetical protein [Tardiphaga sp. 367_B4_N1_1]|uniref:hypothetical protein n=1 Tax=Tardiphaga sp. 367_B4_N1_1 TaxID=3240777 RepID=UPI003F29B580
MPTFQIGLEDGRSLHIEADSQEAALAGVQHFLGQKPAEPSGAAAGFAKGTEDIANGVKETAKQYLGVGQGAEKPSDPNYVPAEVINGFNPLKWNYDQLPQKVAEVAPGLAETAASAMAGSKVGSIAGIRGRFLGGLAGAAGSIWANNAGQSAKADAVRRTGDPNAEPDTGDKTRAGLTEAASALAQSAGPMRFIPGGSAAKAVGAAGLKQAAERWLGTTAVAGASGGAADAISQIGNTIGTDKGVQFDPSRTADAAIGNAGAAALMGAPRGAADAYTAARQRVFGGANADATSAYFNRLQQNAGSDGLGKAKNDFDAHENTKTNLRNELQAVDDTAFPQDTQNTMALARSGKPLTEDHVKSVEASDPQAGYLARQLYVAQQAEQFGSLDRASGSWAGGLSGLADKYAVRPFKSHALISGAAGLTGVHMLGSYAAPTLASAAGVYLGARAVDNLTGMRSPAKGMAERFVDQNVPTRLGPPPAPTPPPQPSAPTPGPWGPRPQANTSVPQVAPQQAPPQAPQLNPVAMTMLKQRLKQGLPQQPAPAAPQAPELSPIAMSMLKQRMKAGLPQEPTPTPEPVPEAPQLSPVAMSMLKQRLKQGLPPEPAPEQASAPQAPQAPQVDPLRLPTDVTAPAKNLMKGISLVQAMKAKATAAPTVKITKSDSGPIQVTDPSTRSEPAAAPTQFYRPLGPEEMTFGGKALEMSPSQIGKYLADKRMADKPEDVRQRYANSVTDTHAERRAIVQDTIAKHPQDVLTLTELLHQLHERGTAEQAKSAVQHYAKQVSPDTAASLLTGFNDEAVKRIWATSAQKKAAKRKAKKNEKQAEGNA